jgi:hypothetical protein
VGTDVPPDQPLMEAGLDSLGAVELRNNISSAFGVDLPATATLDFPTISALAVYLAGVIAPQAAAVDYGYHGGFEADYGQDERQTQLHVAGLSCIYPGM